MKVKVLENFYDSAAGLKLREKDKTFEISDEIRVKALTEKGFVEQVVEEKIETKKTNKAKK